MTRWLCALRALPMTFFIYVLQAWTAVLIALPAANELVARVPTGQPASAHALALERIFQLGSDLRLVALPSLLAGLTWLLVTPFLHIAWLSALARREAFGASLATGGRLYLRACIVSAWVFLGLLAALTPWAGLSYGVYHYIADLPNDRIRDVTCATLLLPLLPSLFIAHTWHDLARARALEEPALRAAMRSVRSALRPRVLLQSLLYSLVGFALLALGQIIELPFPDASHELLVAALQTSLLARLFLRSRWLCDALACADAAGESTDAKGSY